MQRLTRIIGKEEPPLAFTTQAIRHVSPTPRYFVRETSVESGNGLFILARAAAHIEGGYRGRQFKDAIHLLMTLQEFERAAREVAKELKRA